MPGKTVKTAAELEALPVGTVIAEKGTDDIFCRLSDGWVCVESIGAEPSAEIAGTERQVLRCGYYNFYN